MTKAAGAWHAAPPAAAGRAARSDPRDDAGDARTLRAALAAARALRLPHEPRDGVVRIGRAVSELDPQEDGRLRRRVGPSAEGALEPLDQQRLRARVAGGRVGHVGVADRRQLVVGRAEGVDRVAVEGLRDDRLEPAQPPPSLTNTLRVTLSPRNTSTRPRRQPSARRALYHAYGRPSSSGRQTDGVTHTPLRPSSNLVQLVSRHECAGAGVNGGEKRPDAKVLQFPSSSIISVSGRGPYASQARSSGVESRWSMV